MKSYLSRIVLLDYSTFKCTPKLKEDPHPKLKQTAENTPAEDDNTDKKVSHKEYTKNTNVGADLHSYLSPKFVRTNIGTNPHFL